MYYLKTRYYNPEWCRFISSDNISYLEYYNPLGVNLFSYCGNNPVMYVDGDGHMPKWLAWTISGGLVVGGITLSIATAGISSPVFVPILSASASMVVSAGAGSLIGGYLNEITGGSFEAG